MYKNPNKDIWCPIQNFTDWAIAIVVGLAPFVVLIVFLDYFFHIPQINSLKVLLLIYAVVVLCKLTRCYKHTHTEDEYEKDYYVGYKDIIRIALWPILMVVRTYIFMIKK